MRLLYPIVCLALIFGGCAQESTDKRTAPTTVSVRYRGEPVEGAIVTLAIPNSPPPAFGKTDSSGKAIMRTYQENDGALIGIHSVTILKQKIGPSKGAEQGNQRDGEYFPAVGASPLPVVEDLLPIKYKTPASSGLTAEVNKGKNEILFELND